MARFDAVIFDWMLTLAQYPAPSEHVRRALSGLDRNDSPVEVDPIVAALDSARFLPDVMAAESIIDTSAAAHLEGEHLLYQRAGIDRQLADAMYSLLGQSSFHPPYPGVTAVLQSLKQSGLRVGILSDIHVDLRLHAKGFGFAQHIDAWTLSFEVGLQKPDLRIFQAALDQLGTEPSRTLMVGDRASHDGAAAQLGIPCLILPPPKDPSNGGLDLVLRLVDAEPC